MVLYVIITLVVVILGWVGLHLLRRRQHKQGLERRLGAAIERAVIAQTRGRDHRLPDDDQGGVITRTFPTKGTP